MTRFRKTLAVTLCWAILGLQDHCQALEDGLASKNVHPPQALGVLDGGGFFNRNPGALKHISGQLRKLEHDRSYMSYLVVEPVLPASTVAERAAVLATLVLDGIGLVFVFKTDSRNLATGWEVEDQPSAPKIVTRVPSYETAAILDQAMSATDSTIAPEVYLEALIGKLTSEFDAYFKRSDTPPLAAR